MMVMQDQNFPEKGPKRHPSYNPIPCKMQAFKMHNSARKALQIVRWSNAEMIPKMQINEFLASVLFFSPQNQTFAKP
jgi:hypothetical protein